MIKYKSKAIFIILIQLIYCAGVKCQQVADTLYSPEILSKTYPNDDGTIIHIDEAHNNLHTKDGRYYSFAQLLKNDGYRIETNQNKFTDNALTNIDILVIANALSENVTQPIVTPTKSAFSESEILSLKKWVQSGGSLFLIADHMPFAGAAADLASAFEFHFYDSFVMYNPKSGRIDFRIDNGNLVDNFITRGSNTYEKVNRVRSFTGQGFSMPKNASSILNLDASQTVYLVDTMWVFNDKVEKMSAKGLSQGAVMNIDKGKIAVFGEAAMFSAQLGGPTRRKVGMNAEGAEENHQMLLNIIHWLDDKLEED